MQDIWTRLEKWTQKHYKSISDSFLPPASAEQFRTAEETMGLTLPADFRSFYAIHNGQSDDAESGILFGFIPMDLDHICEEWEKWNELLEESEEDDDSDNNTSSPDGHIKKMHFNRKWIPLCHDYGGNFIGIDMDPDAAGTVGQIINFGRDENNKFVIAKSFKDFISNVTKQLEKGNFVIDEEGLNFKNPPVRHFIDGLRQQFDLAH